MHDCRTQGGHFFVYKPQNYAFRCRRCNERFVSSYTGHNLRQPWRCLIERCEYVACDPCSDILAEELAVANSVSSSDEAPLQGLSIDVKSSTEEEKSGPAEKKNGVRRGAAESGAVGGIRDIVKNVVKRKPVPGLGEESRDLVGAEKIEVDDEDDMPYDIPIFTRTARQAAAQAALRRTQPKLRPVTRRGEAGVGEI